MCINKRKKKIQIIVFKVTVVQTIEEKMQKEVLTH